jgi:hypothetical protein
VARVARQRQKRRSVLDLQRAQLGDLNAQNLAENIYNQGASADRLLLMWYEWLNDDRHYRNLDSRQREIRQESLDKALDRVRQELFILRVALGALALLVLLVLIIVAG